MAILTEKLAIPSDLEASIASFAKQKSIAPEKGILNAVWRPIALWKFKTVQHVLAPELQLDENA